MHFLFLVFLAICLYYLDKAGDGYREAEYIRKYGNDETFLIDISERERQLELEEKQSIPEISPYSIFKSELKELKECIKGLFWIFVILGLIEMGSIRWGIGISIGIAAYFIIKRVVKHYSTLAHGSSQVAD